MNAIRDLRCQEIVELVTEYLDDGLSTEDRVRFERHVALCPPCHGYLRQMRAIPRLASGLAEDDLPAAFREGLLAAFADWKRKEPPA